VDPVGGVAKHRELTVNHVGGPVCNCRLYVEPHKAKPGGDTSTIVSEGVSLVFPLALGSCP